MNETGTQTASRRTVLLVEDNPDLRSATEDLLGSLGCEVVTARDSAQALAATQNVSFDMALVNAYPADGSGVEIVDALREELPDLPALLVSGFGDDLALRRRVLEGNVGFLAMPFSRESLQAKIEETVKHQPAPKGSPEIPLIPETSGRPGWIERSRPWLAAASVVLAFGLVLQLRATPPELPDPDQGQTRRGQTIEHIEPEGETNGPLERLVWRSSPGASRYRITLSTLDERTLWMAETRLTSIELPSHIAARLHPAVKYFWRVEGLAQDFSRTGASPLIAFWSILDGPTSN